SSQESIAQAKPCQGYSDTTLVNSEGDSAPLPNRLPKQVAPAKPALETDHRPLTADLEGLALAFSDTTLGRRDSGRVDGTAGCRGLEVPDPRGVQAEYLRLHFVGELWVPVAFDELVGDPELAERLDLPLGTAPQARIGAPQDRICPEVPQQRAEDMRTFEWTAGDRRCECRADLGEEVLPLRLEAFHRGQLLVIRPGGVVGDEVQVGEIVAHRVEILRVCVAGHELTEGDTLVAADVLDAELAAL